MTLHATTTHFFRLLRGNLHKLLSCISFIFYVCVSFYYYKSTQLYLIDKELYKYYSFYFIIQDFILHALELLSFLLINSVTLACLLKAPRRSVLTFLSICYGTLSFSFALNVSVSYWMFSFILLCINLLAFQRFNQPTTKHIMVDGIVIDSMAITLFILMAFLPLFDTSISIFDLKSVFMEVWSLSNYLATVHSALSTNQSPLWSPNLVFGGVPLSAAPQYQYGFIYILYKLFPITIANPDLLIYIHKAQYGIQLICGALGYYFFARFTMRTSRWAALATAGMMLLNLGTINRIAAEAQWGFYPFLVMPYVMMTAVRAVRRNTMLDFAFCGAVFGLLTRFHYSDPELIFGMLYFTLIFVILLWIVGYPKVSIFRAGMALGAIAIPTLASLFPAVAFSALTAADGTVVSSPLGSIGESHYENPSNHLFTVLNDLTGLFTIPAPLEPLKAGLTVYVLGVGRLGGVAIVSFIALFAIFKVADASRSASSGEFRRKYMLEAGSMLCLVVFPIFILAPWSYLGYLSGAPAFPPHSLGRLTIFFLVPFSILFALGFDKLIDTLKDGEWLAPIGLGVAFVITITCLGILSGRSIGALSDVRSALLVLPVLATLFCLRSYGFVLPALLLLVVSGVSYTKIDLTSRDMMVSQNYIEQLMRATPVHFRTAGVRLIDRMLRTDLSQPLAATFTVARRLTIISKMLPEPRAVAALLELPSDLTRELYALRAIQARTGNAAAVRLTSDAIDDLSPLARYPGTPAELLTRLQSLAPRIDAARFPAAEARNPWSTIIPEPILRQEGVRIGLNNFYPVNFGEQTYNNFKLFYPDVSDTYYYPAAVDIYRWVGWLDYYFKDIGFIMNKHMGPANFFPMTNAHHAHLAGIQYALSSAASEQAPFIKQWPLVVASDGYELRRNPSVQREGVLVNAFTPIAPINYTKENHNDVSRVTAGIQLLNTQALPNRPLLEVPADVAERLRAALGPDDGIKRPPQADLSVVRKGNFVLVRTSNVDGAGLLQILSAYHRHWRAFADSDEIAVYRSNLAFQAVVLDKKSSMVWMEFRPPGYHWGMLCYLLILVGILLGLLLNSNSLTDRRESLPCPDGTTR